MFEYEFKFLGQTIVIVNHGKQNQIYWNGEYMYTDDHHSLQASKLKVEAIVKKHLTNY